jgi:hypothetical protein
MRRKRIGAGTRRAVVERADNVCEYCRSPHEFSIDSFAIDHIDPISTGGGSELDNLALACLQCNNAKHDAVDAVDPETGRLAPLFNPRTEKWGDHFRWSEDRLTIVPVSSVGRATVSRLSLNRTGVVNVRRALLALAGKRKA